LQEDATRLIADRDGLVQERRDLARRRAALESSIQDEEARAEQMQESRADLETRKDELDRRISEVEGELMGLVPQLEDQERSLTQARAALDDTKAKIGVLLAKQARSNQYETKAQRDVALREEVKSLGEYETSQTATRSEVQDEVREMQTRLSSIGSTLSEKLAAWSREDAFIRGRASKWDEIKSEEDKLMDERKALWREEKKLKDSTNVLEGKLDGARKTLYESMDRATANGLRAVEEITQRMGLQGVYGPLYKLFTVEGRYKRAVETTAGQSLFHVVVDTDETASKVLLVLNRERSGRVTFVPLNRIKPKNMQFTEKSDALLMIKKVSFDAKYKLAMQQVFARTIICPSLAVASSYVKSDDVNAITIDGDRIERKGALTGGSHDAKKSRLDAAHAVGNYQKEHQAESAKLKGVQAEVASLDQRINTLASERAQLQSRSSQIMRRREVIQHEIEVTREEEQACQKGLKKLQEDQEQISSNLSTCALKKTALQAELQTPLRRGLASGEEAELKALTTLGDEQDKQLGEEFKSVQTMRYQKEMLEIELHGNLKRERVTVATQLDTYGESTGFSQEATEASGRSLAQSIAAHKKQLSDTKKQLNAKQKSLDQMEKQVEDLQSKVKEEQDKLDQMTREQVDEARGIDKLDKILTQIMTKVRDYGKRREDAEQKIRELGVVPGEAYQRHIASSAESIMKAMHKINSALKKYSNVNKRAVEQYENFTRQRDQLLSRQQDLETSSESIQELIETLDMRKDEAIERTFKQVSRNFNEIFEKLVPMGRGMLVMQKKFDAVADDDEEDEDEDPMQVDDEEGEGVNSKKKSGSSIENYTGVSIKVSFHSKVDEGLRIQQLSGGQKSLVALAIVFAIQKCDPAAFYLFDEIDANLDAQYRTAVASMIQELSASAQFITTTFRPELVGVGEKHYGVLFNAHKVSSLQPISQDEAYQFVESSSQTA
jgi:structural maintenance of chromosome 3 (chondroitin sulfate proteoglycan 6)